MWSFIWSGYYWMDCSKMFDIFSHLSHLCGLDSTALRMQIWIWMKHCRNYFAESSLFIWCDKATISCKVSAMIVLIKKNFWEISTTIRIRIVTKSTVHWISDGIKFQETKRHPTQHRRWQHQPIQRLTQHKHNSHETHDPTHPLPNWDETINPIFYTMKTQCIKLTSFYFVIPKLQKISKMKSKQSLRMTHAQRWSWAHSLSMLSRMLLFGRSMLSTFLEHVEHNHVYSNSER